MTDRKGMRCSASTCRVVCRSLEGEVSRDAGQPHLGLTLTGEGVIDLRDVDH